MAEKMAVLWACEKVGETVAGSADYLVSQKAHELVES